MSVTTFVARLEPLEMAALETAIRAGGFELKTVPHAVLSARGEGVTCTLYLSGKCVVQGAGTEQFVARHLAGHEAPPVPMRALEPEFTRRVVGSDESGKGDYFGPLVTAAVACGPEDAAALAAVLIRDSKVMSPGAIRASAAVIRESLPHAIVVIDPPRYNELHARMGNLNRLLAWSHAVAIEEVLEKVDVDMIVIDKFCDERVIRAALKPRALAKELVLRTRAESNPAVAAASILASDAFTRRLAALGKDVGLTLPKGASSLVDAAARRLVRVQGREVLDRVAKVHFRTTGKVLG